MGQPEKHKCLHPCGFRLFWNTGRVGSTYLPYGENTRHRSGSNPTFWEYLTVLLRFEPACAC
ncbi:hypothetical protein NEISICOT_02199 [Neisseria sicca ATCC 29256]|uniref:Uncharacterized protein n=1 Tax=Neisseria sicca ATCC 29256 TaxID=547045 RepID=C6M6P7_NEISI|nr:hypothetical protein NEISICOT_02199 [Neisseria sicca ATCC 29256]